MTGAEVTASELAFWLDKHTEDCPPTCEALVALRQWHVEQAAARLREAGLDGF